jgi:Condensation domain
MPLTGQLFKFLLFQTRADEFHLFACCHHIVIDGFGLALLCQRIASVYSAIVSGAPIAPSIFGSFQDLLDCESEYEASKDYLEDRGLLDCKSSSNKRTLHDGARAYRQQLLVAMFTLVGPALVAQGTGGL